MADEQVNRLTIALCASIKAEDKKKEPFNPLKFIKDNGKIAEGIFDVGKAIGDGEAFLDVVIAGLDCMGDWGSFLGKFIKAVAGKGDQDENKIINEKLDKILEELKKISQQLVNVRQDIAQGVADIIAHVDAAAYRDKITVPSNRLWTLLSKVFESPNERTLKEFLELCKDLSYRPKLLITDMFTYLDGDENILITQLKSKDYAYNTLDKWRACFQVHMMTLAAANVFYYTFTEEEDPKVIEEEVRDMLQQVKRLAVRMFDLDNQRAQLIISSGLAEKIIKSLPSLDTASKDLFDKTKDIIGERPFVAAYAWNKGENFDPSQCAMVEIEYAGMPNVIALIIPQLELSSKAKEKNYDNFREDIEKVSKKLFPHYLNDDIYLIKPTEFVNELSEDSKKRLIFICVVSMDHKSEPAPDGWLSPSLLVEANYVATDDIAKTGVMVQYIMSTVKHDTWPYYPYHIVSAFAI